MSSGRARSQEPLPPGARVGIVGGGQLGRMLALTASRMGYEPHVLAPEAEPPAARFAAKLLRGELDDPASLATLAAAVDVVTFEFENVGSAALAAAAAACEVRPSAQVLHATQDRGREKEFLAAGGFPQVPAEHVTSAAALAAATSRIGMPCVVKTAGFGYDGKGQVVLSPASTAAAHEAAEGLARAGPVVVERYLTLAAELSVIVARGADGALAVYEPIVNRHVGGVLDVSLADDRPGDDWLRAHGLEPTLARRAQELAAAIAAGLEAVGLITVEFFVADSGELYVNEIAPRPHNSGHLTVEAAETSQFEQQLRAVCGLPLGSTRFSSAAAMANLLGDLWADGRPRFADALMVPGVRLHLYGKREARPGRKMGHLTATAASVAEAERRVLAARRALTAV